MASESNSKARSIDLINSATEWGMSVSDRQAKTTALSVLLKLFSYALICLAMVMGAPVVIGMSLAPSPDIVIQYVLITIPLVAVAVYFQVISRSGPRNALQVDHAACEVRLGSLKSDGTFIRHRVCPFGRIEKVYIDRVKGKSPELCLQMDQGTARIAFSNVDEQSLSLLASQITAARESAKKMPIASRITSTFMGIEANAREVGQRVRSRVVTRTV